MRRFGGAPPLLSMLHKVLKQERACFKMTSISGTIPRIYVVDDEWIIAESLAAILSKDGFHAQAFHNPCQAMVRAIGQPPDVLITDVMMPGMTGVELTIACGRAARIAGSCCFRAKPAPWICCATRDGEDSISNSWTNRFIRCSCCSSYGI